MGFVKLEPASRKRLSNSQAVAIVRIGYAPASERQPEAVRVMIDRERLGAAAAWLAVGRHVDAEVDAVERQLRLAPGSTFRIMKGATSARMVFVRLPPFGRPAVPAKHQSDLVWRNDGERLILTIPSWLAIGDAAADEPVETAPVPEAESVVPATEDALERAGRAAGYRMGIPTPKDERERIERSIASRRVVT